ncbi:hypothetical protein QOZ80_UnG0724900 [Eleusine coracana subsp. coracana]|uniref:Uncharacterized protein n=1 Tax=Eleusine coracana subsp. coracana TaxID=191504 RepID=A0AAV9FY97_ELECO|nr:hypothetical protein QOZ80_UnG0724900 [Eleusine coracana subsp. coracana]
MSSTRKHASGSEKRRKKKRIEEYNESQRGAIHKFLQTAEPPRNTELAIIVVEQPDGGASQENIDINNNESSHESNPSVTEPASVDEQPFFPIDIYDPRN